MSLMGVITATYLYYYNPTQSAILNEYYKLIQSEF
jgi:hypothetical protein